MAATANILNLCNYFLAEQRFPLQLAKDVSGKVENCKVAKYRIACGGARAWPGQCREDRLPPVKTGLRPVPVGYALPQFCRGGPDHRS